MAQESIRVSVAPWTRDMDETFQELSVEEISDLVGQALRQKRFGKKTLAVGHYAARVEITIERLK